MLKVPRASRPLPGAPSFYRPRSLGGLTLFGFPRKEPSPRLPRVEEPWGAWWIGLPRGAAFPPPQAAAWFRGLSPLLAPGGPRPWVGWEFDGRQLSLRLMAPASWEATLRGQLSAWSPRALLERGDGNGSAEGEGLPDRPYRAVQPLCLGRPELYALAEPTGQRAGSPDPLSGLLSALAQDANPTGLWMEWGPEPPDWRRWVGAALSAPGDALPPRDHWLTLRLFCRALLESLSAPSAPNLPKGGKAVPPPKADAPVFEARLLLEAEGNDPDSAVRRVRQVAAYLSGGFGDCPPNRLVPAGPPLLIPPGPPGAPATGERIPDSNTPLPFLSKAPKVALAAVEMAALFHFPSEDHPRLPRAFAPAVPPPVSLPDPSAEPGPEGLVLGDALAKEGAHPFSLSPEERRQHLYVVGKTGTGKSTLLASLMAQDLATGRGVGLIDPHGDLAEQVLSLVPPARDGEVLYFDPADVDHPVAFNPLWVRDPREGTLVASGAVGAMRKLYGEFWGPRLEHFLRNALLALLETPRPSFLLLQKLLTDREYRHARVLPYVRDPLVRGFFLEEFERYDPRFRAEALSPILNKLGGFLSSPAMRNLLGQGVPGFDLRALMDGGGIFIANLASGRIGEDHAHLLGALLVTQFERAVKSRADTPEAERRDFYLYVDEFQNLTNDAFPSLLAEARKFRLSLTLAHQYLDQLPAPVLSAVLGNAGTLAAFRAGGPDAARLAKELSPSFSAEDLVHLPDYRFCVRLPKRSDLIPPFSARTRLPEGEPRPIEPLIRSSRERWARSRAEVELEILDRWEGRSD